VIEANQLLDPTSPSVTPPAGAGGAPSVAADRWDVRQPKFAESNSQKLDSTMRHVILACCVFFSMRWASAQVTPVNLVDSILVIQNSAGSNYTETITLFRADGTYQDLAVYSYFSGGKITTLSPATGTYSYATSIGQAWNGPATVGTITWTGGPNKGQSYELYFEAPNYGQPGVSGLGVLSTFFVYPRLPTVGAENVSNNNWISASHPSITGFVIGGDNVRWVLVRGVGPSLTQFGVPNPVSDPSV